MVLSFKSGFYINKRTILGLTHECRKCHTVTSIASRTRQTYNETKRRCEAQRRARKAGAEGTVGKKALSELEKRFGSSCLLCGSINRLQWDHVVPLAKDGLHCISNLQRLCRRCNGKKHVGMSDYRTKGQKMWVIEFRKVKDGE